MEKLCGCRTKLENFPGWTVVLHGESLLILCKLFHWKSFAVPIDSQKPQNFSTSNDLHYTVASDNLSLLDPTVHLCHKYAIDIQYTVNVENFEG